MTSPNLLAQLGSELTPIVTGLHDKHCELKGLAAAIVLYVRVFGESARWRLYFSITDIVEHELPRERARPDRGIEKSLLLQLRVFGTALNILENHYYAGKSRKHAS